MPGYIHLYAKNSYEGTHNYTSLKLHGELTCCETYTPELEKVCFIETYEKKLSHKAQGKNVCQGNLGVFTVQPCEGWFTNAAYAFKGTFSQNIIELTLSNGLAVTPLLTHENVCFGHNKRTTFISVKQYVPSIKQYQEVVLRSNAYQHDFAFKVVPENEKIDASEWHGLFARNEYPVTIDENFFDVSPEEIEEQLFKEVPDATRSKTSIIEAFKPII